MNEKILAVHEQSKMRIRVYELKPPRQIDIRVENPIEGAPFRQYRILLNQEWEHAPGDRSIMRAENTDHEPHPLIGVPVGDPIYSLYGVFGNFDSSCIGDFETFDKLLVVLIGMGLISRTDWRNLLVMAVGMDRLKG